MPWVDKQESRSSEGHRVIHSPTHSFIHSLIFPMYHLPFGSMATIMTLATSLKVTLLDTWLGGFRESRCVPGPHAGQRAEKGYSAVAGLQTY